MAKQILRLTRAALVILVGLAATPAHAGSASLLLDINQGDTVPPQAEIQGQFLSLGSAALVEIIVPGSGRELWATDGTEAGTRLVLDLCPGPCSSYFSPLGTVRQVGIFLARAENERDSRLWRSDGTRAGTFPLTVSGGDLQSCGTSAAATGSALLFAGRVAGGKCGLWRTDGTLAGSVKLGDQQAFGFTAAGGRVFFTTGRELWRSDGTPDGTAVLRTWQSGSLGNLLTAGARLFFTAPEDGRELWTSDGTADGTVPLTRFALAEPFVRRNSFDSSLVLQDAGGLACFLADDTLAGRELWCSDGTPAGTRPATAMALANPFLGLATWRVERLGSRLVFPANDGIHGNRWWTSDGGAASAALLGGCAGECPQVDERSPLARAGDRVFFASPGGDPDFPEDPPATDLWVTDGTGAGTRRMRDFCDDCRIGWMFPLLGKLFFSGGELLEDYGIWASDGTAQGTRLLLPLRGHSAESFPIYPAAVAGRALLTQTTGLWASDGTPGGTSEVAFLARNAESSQPDSLVPLPDGVRFLAQDGETRSVWTSGGTAATTTPLDPGISVEHLTAFGSVTLLETVFNDVLWRTDGTAAGTFRLDPGRLRIGRPVVVGSRALFLAWTGTGLGTASLWSTDGTVAGTRQVVELPEAQSALSGVGDAALIVMYTASRYVLWRTDGTAAGTREIPLPEDFSTFDNGDRAQLGSALFFSASSRTQGNLLWRTDGGEARPFAASLLRDPGSFAVRAGALYVLAHTTGATPANGLFRSDGTEAGTVLLATVPRSTTASPTGAQFTAVGPLVFFAFTDSQGRELWRTDGTPAGTFRVRDIVPGAGSPGLDHLTALGGRLEFTAAGPGTGTELWESDGTEAGTHLVQDIAPGVLSSAPDELVAAGGRLYFTADDGVHGREPWVYTPDAAPCTTTSAALCLGGRFRVESDWRAPGGLSGRGHAAALTADTGTFWFFDPANVEVILKVLDGRGVNGHHWVFYGALSNVEYALTVTDVLTGAARRYVNPGGRLGSVADVTAFGPLGAWAAGAVTDGPAAALAEGEALVTRGRAAAVECAASATRLCLGGGRFAVEARWKDFQGRTGTGQAAPLSGDTGTFWFFDQSNVEVVLKVLDGRPLNGKFWVFYGALSNVEYTLTVTDTATGITKTYTNPSGRLASVADTGAF